jgi:alpha-tubulin suppressor-like RCC1 family protein
MLNLLPENLFQIIIPLSIRSIPNICRISKHFNNIIGTNNDFWKLKFIHDYDKFYENVFSWKEKYEKYTIVYGSGLNWYGQLGLGDSIKRDVPTKLPWNDTNTAKMVSCGDNFTILLDIDGNIWSVGDDSLHGKLGLGDKIINQYTPKLLPWSIENKAKYISSGIKHTLIVDANDEVWSFGQNASGQLGLGDSFCRYVPTKLKWDHKAKFISCHCLSSMILDTTGNIWFFGRNRYTGLGFNDGFNLNPVLIPWSQENKAKFISCNDRYSTVIDTNDDVWFDDGKLIKIPNIKANSASLSVGTEIIMIIDLDNNLWIYKINCDNHLESIPRFSGITKSVLCCYNCSFIIDMDNNIWKYKNEEFTFFYKGRQVVCGLEYEMILV